MKKKAVVVLTVLAACGGDGGSWPQSEREAFIENCERTSGGETEACDCLLEKVEERYPEPEDALDLSIGEMGEMAEECK